VDLQGLRWTGLKRLKAVPFQNNIDAQDNLNNYGLNISPSAKL